MMKKLVLFLVTNVFFSGLVFASDSFNYLSNPGQITVRRGLQPNATLLEQVFLSPVMLPYSGIILGLNSAFLVSQILKKADGVRQGASKTAEGVAHVRSMFSELGLCNDHLASLFIQRKHKFINKIHGPYYWYWSKVADLKLGIGAIAARSDLGDQIFTRFLDKANSKPAEKFRVLHLGAGFDTRFYRFKEMIPSNVELVEVDIATTQATKLENLEQASIETGHVNFLSIDFGREDLEAKLREKGFWQEDVVTLFFWEGVSMYLSEENVNKVLNFVGKSASESEFYFDVFIDFFTEDAPFKKSWVGYLNEKLVVNKGEPIRFGIKDRTDEGLNEFLSPFKLEAISTYDSDSMERLCFTRPSGRIDAGCVDYVIFIHAKVP